jgi:hypothetical protein
MKNYDKFYSMYMYLEMIWLNIFWSIQIKNVTQLWKWLDGDFLKTMSGNKWYNNRPTNLSSGVLKDYASILVGSIMIRQVRAIQSKSLTPVK